jgi:acetylornithine deacetylase/succinyl-diaminopimelate desuccinylase-like protein
MPAILDELVEWLRIPSISSGGGDPADLRRAAEWVCARVEEAGGEGRVKDTTGNPLALGELRARRSDAPTVWIYGHYDVQSPEPLGEWTTPPFEPELRDGRIYARGACDDKGNFLPLLHTACALARAGELPVHVRVLVEGEEEIAGTSVIDHIRHDPVGADCAVVFDSVMVGEGTPALTVSARGIVYVGLKVRTGRTPVHSGMGNAVLNALDVLAGMVRALGPDASGRLPAQLVAGAADPGEWERADEAGLPPGAEVIEEMGGRPHDADAAADFYRRTAAAPSVEIHGIDGGDAGRIRTAIPVEARAMLSMRLAPGQRSADAAVALEGMLRAAAPANADVEVDILSRAEPAAFDPASPALQLASAALERAAGVPAVALRMGGSLPLLSAFSERGIPAVVTGFAVTGDRVHGPDESYRLESLRLGEAAARELLTALAALPR